ncbi:MAG: carbohydrate-binding domain-containing protein, partial [Lachnospiraceae bacterium]|nr:carbohydrate-binding domain-containing protein [Lachnospiraceae bacterium]
MLILSKGKRSILAAAIAFIFVFSLFSYTGLGVIESYAADNTFTFSDGGITTSATGEGYSIEGTTLTINASGTYEITGSCSEGQVVVKKGVTDVTLVLNGLTLRCSSSAPIVIKKESSVTIDVEGTNTLTDAENPDDENSTDADVADAFEGAAIKVKSNSSLVITGSGTLNVDGSTCKNGIKGASLSSITVKGSVTINGNAANNVLASDNQVTINGGILNLTSIGGDGIKAEPDDDDTDSAGNITITGGSINITAADDGIQAAGDLDISGGYITVNSADDAIHANNINAKGGTYTIDAGDDGIHAEYDLIIGT